MDKYLWTGKRYPKIRQDQKIYEDAIRDVAEELKGLSLIYAKTHPNAPIHEFVVGVLVDTANYFLVE